jgi:hypothetical protein
MSDSLSNILDSFANKFKDFDWFSDITIESGRVIIYVYWMSGDTLSMLPDKLAGMQVLVHYSSNVKLDNLDINLLIKELDRLEKICGSNPLQDIFYEIHDGDNCVTNLSIKYPDVSSSMRRLYDEYGFDVIYEELDG